MTFATKPILNIRHLLLVALILSPIQAFAEHTRVTNPNSLAIEVMGRGLFWGLQFDRVVSDDLVAGVEWGGTPTKDLLGNDMNITARVFSAYANYYFTRDQGSLFATGGVTLISNTNSVNGLTANVSGVKFTSTGMMPSFGVGYENRSDAGFIFRATGYGFVLNKIYPWAGMTLGVSF
ncbi:MAG: hypothetical protein AABZ55_10005 [Bdellovibrionota bacterium]